MKSYLSLIPISAKMRKKENKITIICIILAVFLVTSIFSMAEIGIDMEKARIIEKHGVEGLAQINQSQTANSLYLIASFLFILILAAGVLMISSTINSNIIQRTKFFGMMRCIGMSKKQVRTFVRLEALNWCKTAIPIGLILGVLSSWILSFLLKFLVGGEFREIGLLTFSPIGVASGILMGVVTVLISASAPARKASKVSPISAISANKTDGSEVTKGVNLKFFKLETALGIHHARSKKKNFILMTSSFALSIILFLSFSVLIEFVGHIMPQTSNDHDFTISSKDGLNSLDKSLIGEIESLEFIDRVFARRNQMDIPVESSQSNLNFDKVDLISYSDFDLACLEKDGLLKKSSKLPLLKGDTGYVIASPDSENLLQIGDKIQIGGRNLEVAGLLKFNIFSNDGSDDGTINLISTDESFTSITGHDAYSLIMVKAKNSISEEQVLELSELLGDEAIFNDRREQRTDKIYLAFQIFIYGFLAIIALVALLNIVNSIAISVASRLSQYGVMAAVGMSKGQLSKMIRTEALVYSISGSLLGSVLGLLVSKNLYTLLISKHFPNSLWQLPLTSLAFILVFVAFATALAVYKPIKQMKEISIIDTIKEL